MLEEEIDIVYLLKSLRTLKTAIKQKVTLKQLRSKNRDSSLIQLMLTSSDSDEKGNNDRNANTSIDDSQVQHIMMAKTLDKSDQHSTAEGKNTGNSKIDFSLAKATKSREGSARHNNSFLPSIKR